MLHCELFEIESCLLLTIGVGLQGRLPGASGGIVRINGTHDFADLKVHALLCLTDLLVQLLDAWMIRLINEWQVAPARLPDLRRFP